MQKQKKVQIIQALSESSYKGRTFTLGTCLFDVSGSVVPSIIKQGKKKSETQILVETLTELLSSSLNNNSLQRSQSISQTLVKATQPHIDPGMVKCRRRLL
jgi:hypothetical protein